MRSLLLDGVPRRVWVTLAVALAAFVVAPAEVASSSMRLCRLAAATASLEPSRVSLRVPTPARNSVTFVRSSGNSCAATFSRGRSVRRFSKTDWRPAYRSNSGVTTRKYTPASAISSKISAQSWPRRPVGNVASETMARPPR